MLETVTSALSFVVLLGVLVFIHELGHFLVAKKVGIRVDKFSLGFPPNILSFKRGETEYCLGLIPLGGYVKMAGETPGEESSGRSDEFSSKTIGQRFLVIFAGPFMNYVLAVFLFAGLLYAYGEPVINENAAVVGMVSPDSPASQAGLQSGDIIVSIDGLAIANFDSLRSVVTPRAGEEMTALLERGTEFVSVTIIPEAQEVVLEDGSKDTVGLIGVGIQVDYERTHGIIGSLGEGFSVTNKVLGDIFAFVKNYATGNIATNSVGGPIYIAQQSAQAARQGLYSFLALMALLSVNLAALNVLPIPVLDGGHMVFLAVEKIKGSPLTMKVRMYAQQAGMLFLLMFIVFVSWNDVMRMISG